MRGTGFIVLVVIISEGGETSVVSPNDCTISLTEELLVCGAERKNRGTAWQPP